MLTIAPYSAWCKGNVAQNNDNFTEATDGENLLHEARVVEVSMHFSSSRKPANANVQKHPKRSTRVYINNNHNKLKFIPRSFYKNIQLRLTINIKLKIK